MKLTFCRPLLALFLGTCLLPAQQPAPKPAVKPAASNPNKIDSDKPSQAELDKIHTLATMSVEFSGFTHQVVFELLGDHAPKTVENFIKNAEEGTYRGQAFHRAVPDYLVQTGDPLSKDKSTREQWGLSQQYTLPAEIKLPHVPGAVAMARRSDKVNPKRLSDGTQFYFALGDLTALDGQYTVFGQVISGMESLREMSKVLTDSNDCPLERVEIKSIAISRHKGVLPALTEKSSKDKKKRLTTPESAKGPVEKFLNRIW